MVFLKISLTVNVWRVKKKKKERKKKHKVWRDHAYPVLGSPRRPDILNSYGELQDR